MTTQSGQGSSQILTPGQILSAARKQRGLSLANIAENMRLSIQTIKDIEMDNYEHIGVRAFVRGYLCGYARLVNLPQERVLESFSAMNVVFAEDSTILAESPAQVLCYQTRNFLKRRNIVVGVVIIAAIGFVIAALNHSSAQNQLAKNTEHKTLQVKVLKAVSKG